MPKIHHAKSRVGVAGLVLGRGVSGRSVAGRNDELAEEGVEPFLMGKGETLKFDADAGLAGPANRSLLNEKRDLLSGDIQEKIHVHAGEDRGGAFETAACARDIH